MTIPPLPDDAKTPGELFAAVDSYINQVHGIIERHEFLELKGLDTFVDYLCKRVLELPKEDAIRYAERLVGLHAAMNQLQSHLETAKQEVRGEIEKVNKHAAANKAYKPKA